MYLQNFLKHGARIRELALHKILLAPLMLLSPNSECTAEFINPQIFDSQTSILPVLLYYILFLTEGSGSSRIVRTDSHFSNYVTPEVPRKKKSSGNFYFPKPSPNL